MKWPIPERLDELRELPVRRKGEWAGAGWLLAALVWLLRLGPLALGAGLALAFSPWWWLLASCTPITAYIAHVFMTEFHTVWFGTIWLIADTPDDEIETRARGIMEHEGVHDYHQGTVPGYLWKYVFPVPVWRREAEGLAYALDVVRGRRSRENAAQSFSHWIYFQFLTKKKALQVLERCEARWRAECADVD